LVFDVYLVLGACDLVLAFSRRFMRFLDFTWYFFDFDGTLVDSAGDIIDNLQRAYNTIPRFMGVNAASVKIGPPLATMLKVLTPDVTESEIKTLTEEFMKMYLVKDFKKTAFFPGAKELIDLLASKEKKLGLVTNKPTRNLGFLFEKLGSFGLFSKVMTPDMHAGRKIDKLGMFKELIDGGVKPQSAVMIGDAGTDISSAQAYGVKTIGILEGYSSEDEIKGAKPDACVRNMRELLAHSGDIIL